MSSLSEAGLGMFSVGGWHVLGGCELALAADDAESQGLEKRLIQGGLECADAPCAWENRNVWIGRLELTRAAGGDG